MNEKKIFLILVLNLVVLSTFALATHETTSCTTNPPSSCAIRPPGCYTSSSTPSNSMTPAQWGYYIESSECIITSVSIGCGHFDQCQCNIPTPPRIEADTSATACGCIQGSPWLNQAGCCGDDKLQDCGLPSSNTNTLCKIDSGLTSSSWELSAPNTGDIEYLGCNNWEYLSDGSQWIQSNTFQIKENINGHDYISLGKPGQESWIECCGEAGCNSDPNKGGKRFNTGQSADTSIRNPCPPGEYIVSFDGNTPTCGTGPAPTIDNSPPGTCKVYSALTVTDDMCNGGNCYFPSSGSPNSNSDRTARKLCNNAGYDDFITYEKCPQTNKRMCGWTGTGWICDTSCTTSCPYRICSVTCGNDSDTIINTEEITVSSERCNGYNCMYALDAQGMGKITGDTLNKLCGDAGFGNYRGFDVCYDIDTTMCGWGNARWLCRTDYPLTGDTLPGVETICGLPTSLGDEWFCRQYAVPYARICSVTCDSTPDTSAGSCGTG